MPSRTELVVLFKHNSENLRSILSVFSPDGTYLVTSDGNRKVTLYNVSNDYAKANNREWGFHTAKVNCVSWSPNSLYVASGGLDCSLIVWSVEKPEKHKIQTCAHAQSQITDVVWLDNQSIATCGQDGNVKIWDVDLTRPELGLERGDRILLLVRELGGGMKSVGHSDSWPWREMEERA